MPEYQYVSKDINGKVYRGLLEAENLDGFYRNLRERSQFCISVRAEGRRQNSLNIGSERIGLKDLSIFCRQFSTMLNSGITVIKCLDILYQQAEKTKLKRKILGIYEAVQKGDSLSGAMRAQKNAFPFFFINMVEAGEASGSLDHVMQRMADTYEKDCKLKNKVRQALTYPIFLICLTICIVIFLLTFVLPKFIGMFSQLKNGLPLPTAILVGISHFLMYDWYFLLGGCILIMLLWMSFIRSKSGRLNWDKLKLNLPVTGKLLMTIKSAIFSRTLGALVSSGMPIIEAIEITGRVVGNRYIETKLSEVMEQVRRGTSLSFSLKKAGLFPPMLCSMVSIGEESGNMDEILQKTSAFYDEESDSAIQRMIALIEPVMILLLALIVGFVVLSIILPIFKIYQQMNAGV